MWNLGDHLSHRYNPDLGPGRVVEIQDRRMTVLFPDSGKSLRFATDAEALMPLVFKPYSPARVMKSGEVVTIEACDDDHCRLTDGREMSIHELWPVPAEASPIELLASGRVGSVEDFKNRLDALRLERLREADGLGSFLGGRIHLFPHQLYVADRACRRRAELGEPVRWLLADEVGLGKTVEACLIMNRLIHVGEANRTLVVAPETLTVQWLGELWRKYHQVFVLIDDRRMADLRRVYGRKMNPFEAHPKAIISLERLAENPRLVRLAKKAGIDLLVVDEAHHLRRPPGHPGRPEYRAIEPLARRGRHVLLLSATPLEDDAHGFFRLLQLLRPEEFPQRTSFHKRLRRRQTLPPCTSATRRVDIGGLPPRVPAPVEVGDKSTWGPLLKLERRMRNVRAPKPGEAKRKIDRVSRALASSAALAATLPRNEENAKLHRQIEAAGIADPRVKWLGEQMRPWLQRREKTLIFVAHRETLDMLKPVLEHEGKTRVAIFHEALSTERRDLEVAQFRMSEGPPVMISTEAGGEGRNFQFCHRLVLFDLPWNPATVEQRIGRLDRIGRDIPTEIVYFRPPAGFGLTLVELYEKIGIFTRPLGGLVRELRDVAQQIERTAVERGGEDFPFQVFEKVLREARQAYDRVRQAAYHELHRDPYHSGMADEILDRVPEELDVLIEDLVIRAVSRLGFKVEELPGPRSYVIELGSGALVDNLPGVKAGSSFRGTFDRETAVEDESLDFFANGHPLIEGVLAELADGPRGRTALLQVRGDEEVFGLLGLYKRGAEWEAVAVDSKGQKRDDLAARLTGSEAGFEHSDKRRWTAQANWAEGIRRLASALPKGELPQVLAAFRVRREGA